MRIISYLEKKLENIKPFWIFTAVFFFALVVRMSAFFVLNRFHSAIIDDSMEYLRQANNLWSGGWAGQFPNGYPVILAFISLFSAKEIAFVAVNLVFSSLVAAMVSFVVFRRTGARLPAAAAGLLLAFWYNQINWSTMVLSEAPSAFFLVLGVLLIMQNKMYGGIAIGVASVIRTTMLPVGFLVAWRQKSCKLFLYFLIPAVFMMGMGYFLAGNPSIGGNLAQNIYISANLLPNGQPNWQVPQGTTIGQAIQKYAQAFFTNPLHFLYKRWQQLWILWGVWPYTEKHGLLADILLKTLIGSRFLLLAFAGYFYYISKNKNNDDFLLWTPVFVITVVHVLLFAEIRYTYTIEPLVAALLFSHLYFFLKSDA